MSTGIIDFLWTSKGELRENSLRTRQLVFAWSLETAVNLHNSKTKTISPLVCLRMNKSKFDSILATKVSTINPYVYCLWKSILIEKFSDSNRVANTKMGLFESKFLEGEFDEPEWLEKESYGGLRVWHLGFFGFSGFVCICMCIYFLLSARNQPTSSKIVLNCWFSLLHLQWLCCAAVFAFEFHAPNKRLKPIISAEW